MIKNETIAFLVTNLTSDPGVYLMEDKNGKIIYIGKAKNLKKRVSQYFEREQVGKVKAMVERVVKFSTIVTNSEKEAFILELKLIQTHYPRYNVMLKDDSHYPYIAVSKTGDPVVKIERKANNPNNYYYGPFPASQKAYQIVDLVNKLFKTKKCKGHHHEPCFYYHLGQCLGYCFNEVTEEEKAGVRTDVLNFLDGRDQKTLKHYESLMKQSSAALDFEKALEYKTLVSAIKHIYVKQNVELEQKIDVDVIAYTTNGDSLGLNIVSYRKGVLLAEKFEAVSLFGESNEQVLTLLGQYYKTNLVPKMIFIGSSYIGSELALLYPLKVIVPKQGKNLDILNRAYQNASEALSKHLLFHQQSSDQNELLTSFAALANIDYPRQIDLVDIAHLSGQDALGVVTTFINGHPFKKLYRKYNITSLNKSDDYLSMHEVLTRHYERKLAEGKNLPDLLLVDGGLGQLNVALDVRRALKLTFPIFGLVKNDKHRTRGVLNENEEISVPRPILNFLAGMQEEVHRYAILSHRHKRIKSSYISVFDGVKGLGEKRRALLLKTYGTVEAIRQVSSDELAQFIPLDVAKRLLNHLNEVLE